MSYRIENWNEDSDAYKGEHCHSGSIIVRNLTRDTAFQNVCLQINAGKTTTTTHAPDGLTEPLAGTFLYGSETFKADPEARKLPGVSDSVAEIFLLTYRIDEIQPRHSWRLRFWHLHVDSPTLAIRMGPPPPTGQEQAGGEEFHFSLRDPVGAHSSASSGKIGEKVSGVQLVKVNWQTRLVEYEIQILAALVVTFTFLLVAFLAGTLTLARSTGNPPDFSI